MTFQGAQACSTVASFSIPTQVLINPFGTWLYLDFSIATKTTLLDPFGS